MSLPSFKTFSTVRSGSSPAFALVEVKGVGLFIGRRFDVDSNGAPSFGARFVFPRDVAIGYHKQIIPVSGGAHPAVAAALCGGTKARSIPLFASWAA